MAVSKVTWSPLIAAPCTEKFPDSLTIILAALMAVRSLQCVTPGAMKHLNLYFRKIERIDPSEAKTHTETGKQFHDFAKTNGAWPGRVQASSPVPDL